MPRSNFVPFVAPSLPPWPPLMFDRTNRHAVVSARLATWRSVENARVACGVLWAVVAIWIGRVFWTYTSARTESGEAAIFTFWGTLFVAGAVYPLLFAAFQGFLARQVFCTRVKVWFRPDAIAFRSTLYSRPVVVRRSWNGAPMQCSFEVKQDLDVAALSDHTKPGHETRHFATAYLLRMIVETTNPYHAVPKLQQAVSVREIPMMEIDEKDASRVPIVLLLAASLTIAEPDEHRGPDQPAMGVDIDTA